MFEIVFNGGNRWLPELEDGDWLRDVLQSVLPEIGERRAVDEVAGRTRQHYLAPVPGRAYPRGEVDVVSDVALIRDERRTRVQADTQLDRPRCQSVRHRLRCRNRPLDGREGEEEGVSLVVDLDPALGRARLAHDVPVLGEGVRIRFRTQLVQEQRRPFDVGEEERDRAGREIVSHAQ